MIKFLVTGGSGFIGTNFIDVLLEKEADILNIDINPPQKHTQAKFWFKCNVLEKDKLHEIFSIYKPTHVVHLAARTDTVAGLNLSDYRVNIEGTSNVLEAIKDNVCIEQVIITSSQFVHQYRGIPENDEDYAPHTTYGESKVLTEQITRKAGLNCTWSIIRPTNIWGPWHPRYAKEFWYILKKGRYFHPSKQLVMRSYGFVGNVVHQIEKIFECPATIVHEKVFYTGDAPINLYDWVNGFSQALTGKNVRIVPSFFVKTLALTGDLLSFVGIPFPIGSSRYKSMTSDNAIPMEKTFQVLGSPRYTLQQGIDKTVEWLIEQDPAFWSRGRH